MLDDESIAWPPPNYNSGVQDFDRPVQATHLDAASAKKICTDIGYFQDSFNQALSNLVPPRLINAGLRNRHPMINRGYYCRTMAMRRACEMFVKKSMSNTTCSEDLPLQIVNLGSGLDTLYWYCKDNIKKWAEECGSKRKDDSDLMGSTGLTFFETDFPSIIARKTSNIIKKGLVEDPQTSKSQLHQVEQLRTKSYRLVACDMRQTNELRAGLTQAGFNAMAHTLFLSECVLVYIQPSYSDNIIQCCRDMCVSVGSDHNESTTGPLHMFVTYEQTKPNTRFGKEMLKNLNIRGCPLLSISQNKEDLCNRYSRLGWSGSQHALYMNEWCSKYITEEEIVRLNKVEMLDELEELTMIHDHYLLLIAVGGDGWRAEEVY